MKTERELEEEYDDFLDDCYGEVSIVGFKYNTSYALKEIDPVAYRCGFSDYVSGLEEEDEDEEVE